MAKQSGEAGAAAILSPAEKPPHPDLLPARGEKEARSSLPDKISSQPPDGPALHPGCLLQRFQTSGRPGESRVPASGLRSFPELRTDKLGEATLCGAEMHKLCARQIAYLHDACMGIAAGPGALGKREP